MFGSAFVVGEQWMQSYAVGQEAKLGTEDAVKDLTDEEQGVLTRMTAQDNRLNEQDAAANAARSASSARQLQILEELERGG